MYKLLFFIFGILLSAQQNCELSFFNSCILKEGKILFTIQNVSDENIRVPKEYSTFWARPESIEVYNEDEKKYIPVTYQFDSASGINFKTNTRLKKGEFKSYLVEIIPGRVSAAFQEKKKYRFKIDFDIYLFSSCSDYLTDWIYYDNSKNVR